VGKTTEQVAMEIAEGLKGRYLKNPVVSVAVKFFNSRSYFIHGAVHNPGMYQIDGAPSLLRLVAMSGGLTENHGSQALILRERAATAPDEPEVSGEGEDAATEPVYNVVTVNLAGLLRGDLNANAILEPGDVVHISPASVFYVAGEVRAPGSFPLKDGTTLRQAVSLAQGLTFTAAAGRAVIFREDTRRGERIEIPVELDDVMNGKKADIALMENDVVIVPNSRAKSIGSALLTALGLSAARLPGR
jgi:polysaccharide export outer membrane protein